MSLHIFHGKKRDLIAHGGNNNGAHCFAVASVERKSGYVIMTNGDTGVDVLSKLMETINPYLAD